METGAAPISEKEKNISQEIEEKKVNTGVAPILEKGITEATQEQLSVVVNEAPTTGAQESDDHGRQIPPNGAQESDDHGRQIPPNGAQESDDHGRQIPPNGAQGNDDPGRELIPNETSCTRLVEACESQIAARVGAHESQTAHPYLGAHKPLSAPSAGAHESQSEHIGASQSSPSSQGCCPKRKVSEVEPVVPQDDSPETDNEEQRQKKQKVKKNNTKGVKKNKRKLASEAESITQGKSHDTDKETQLQKQQEVKENNTTGVNKKKEKVASESENITQRKSHDTDKETQHKKQQEVKENNTKGVKINKRKMESEMENVTQNITQGKSHDTDEETQRQKQQELKENNTKGVKKKGNVLPETENITQEKSHDMDKETQHQKQQVKENNTKGAKKNKRKIESEMEIVTQDKSTKTDDEKQGQKQQEIKEKDLKMKKRKNSKMDNATQGKCPDVDNDPQHEKQQEIKGNNAKDVKKKKRRGERLTMPPVKRSKIRSPQAGLEAAAKSVKSSNSQKKRKKDSVGNNRITTAQQCVQSRVSAFAPTQSSLRRQKSASGTSNSRRVRRSHAEYQPNSVHAPRTEDWPGSPVAGMGKEGESEPSGSWKVAPRRSTRHKRAASSETEGEGGVTGSPKKRLPEPVASVGDRPPPRPGPRRTCDVVTVGPDQIVMRMQTFCSGDAHDYFDESHCLVNYQTPREDSVLYSRAIANSFASAGFILLAPGAVKPLSTNEDSHLTFYLVSGSLEVVVQNKKRNVKMSDTWFVPFGCPYQLTNRSTKTAEVFVNVSYIPLNRPVDRKG